MADRKPRGRVAPVEIEFTETNVHPVVPNALLPPLYKVLREDGTPSNGGKGAWPLPEDGRPGEWRVEEGPLQMCRVGLHLTEFNRINQWLQSSGLGCRVFLAEVDGPAQAEMGNWTHRTATGKWLAGRVRLVEEIEEPTLLWEFLNAFNYQRESLRLDQIDIDKIADRMLDGSLYSRERKLTWPIEEEYRMLSIRRAIRKQYRGALRDELLALPSLRSPGWDSIYTWALRTYQAERYRYSAAKATAERNGVQFKDSRKEIRRKARSIFESLKTLHYMTDSELTAKERRERDRRMEEARAAAGAPPELPHIKALIERWIPMALAPSQTDPVKAAWDEAFHSLTKEG